MFSLLWWYQKSLVSNLLVTRKLSTSAGSKNLKAGIHELGSGATKRALRKVYILFTWEGLIHVRSFNVLASNRKNYQTILTWYNQGNSIARKFRRDAFVNLFHAKLYAHRHMDFIWCVQRDIQLFLRKNGMASYYHQNI